VGFLAPTGDNGSWWTREPAGGTVDAKLAAPGEEERMSEEAVLRLFRKAVAESDPAAMQQGLERLFGLDGVRGPSAEDEYLVRHPDYVLEMPQSGERIRGRDAMRAMQEAFPTPPTVTLRRVVGAGDVWVVEGVNDYAGDVWRFVVTLELDQEGRIVRDTRYYVQETDAPAWRAVWVEPI
jgi:hypothetical protein